jgi:hypothetical protein
MVDQKCVTRIRHSSGIHHAYSLEKAEAEPTATERTTAFNICGRKKISVSPRGTELNMFRARLAGAEARTEARHTSCRDRSYPLPIKPWSTSRTSFDFGTRKSQQAKHAQHNANKNTTESRHRPSTGTLHLQRREPSQGGVAEASQHTFPWAIPLVCDGNLYFFLADLYGTEGLLNLTSYRPWLGTPAAEKTKSCPCTL